MTENNAVLEYANLKIQIKDLEEKVEFLKPAVLKEIQEIKNNNSDPDAPVSIPDVGEYQVQVRTTYEYSDEVKEKEKALKKLKADEVRLGTAEIKEENTILVFKSKKE